MFLLDTVVCLLPDILPKLTALIRLRMCTYLISGKLKLLHIFFKCNIVCNLLILGFLQCFSKILVRCVIGENPNI